MKKIPILIVSCLILIYINGCTGYEPIFGSSNFKFTIKEYSIEGDKKIGNQIYANLYNITRPDKNNSDLKNVKLKINASKNKVGIIKSSTGKILEYKISLIADVIVINILNNKNIFNQNFIYSSQYKVQDQHSETLKLENKTIKNLTNKISQELVIKISEGIMAE